MTRTALHCALLCCCVIAVLSCQLSDRKERVDTAVADSDLVRQLNSVTSDDRQQALAALQSEDVVSDVILSALVESFRYDTVMRLPGPPAATTQTSRLLVKFSPASIPHLIDGLSSTDANVRRHAAFTLGELRADSMIPALRDAIDAELHRAVAAIPSSTDPRMTLAPFRAMVDAYGKTSHVDALRWIADRTAETTTGLEADLLLGSLVRLEPQGPSCERNSAVTCAGVWKQWIAERFNAKHAK
jgi:hypothetical protein